MAKRKQCEHCPWKVGTNPHEIPHGYCSIKHAKLKRTIADPLTQLNTLNDPMYVMGCHEAPQGVERACVGWMGHQLHQGNNIQLRLAMLGNRFDKEYVLDGPQHKCFEDTLPKDNG